jgi:drug/metabolite transporter (DMT)-like permease
VSVVPEVLLVVTILALAAAMLYGTADFLGGVASRRASVFAVLALTVPAGAVLMVLAALLGGLLGHGGLGAPTAVGSWSDAGWAAGSGVCGACGLVAFYAGFASSPISVVAPVAALISAVLPVGVAVAGGERPGAGVIAGGLICLVAIVLVSAQPAHGGQPPYDGQQHDTVQGDGATGRGDGAMGRRDGVGVRGSARPGTSGLAGPGTARRPAAASRLLALGYGLAAGAGFGLFFIFLKNAGQSGVLWPVAISRSAGTVVAFGIALATGTRLWPRRGSGITRIALVSGTIDAAANVCYVLATRAGLFGLAVVITSLYPGMTVLLARLLLGERMQRLQRAGLLLAAVGVVLVTV